MPKLNKEAVKHRLAEANITSTEALAEATEIPWGSLRNGLAGRDSLTLARIYRIAEQVVRPGEEVKAVVAEITAGGTTPSEPPKNPRREPTSPPSRQDSEKTKTTPRRNTSALLAEAS
ncbi:hypothetical protein DMC63_01550 [Streptomyces sp. WAC 05977]|nr:hypothetical protein DMC63_01550 [Streptomyces sp. WAC 05977]